MYHDIMQACCGAGTLRRQIQEVHGRLHTLYVRVTRLFRISRGKSSVKDGIIGSVGSDQSCWAGAKRRPRSDGLLHRIESRSDDSSPGRGPELPHGEVVEHHVDDDTGDGDIDPDG